MSKISFLKKIILYLLLIIPSGLKAQNISGIWKSVFFAEGATYSVILQLHEAGNDSSYYSLKTDMGSGTIGFQDLEETGNHISFSFWENMRFEGDLESNNDIKGTIHYNEKKYDVTFKKIADKPVDMFANDNADNGDFGFNDPFANDELAQPGYGVKKGFNYMPLFVWGLIWLIIGLLLWLLIRQQKKYTGSKEEYKLNSEEDEHVNKLLPLIRLGRRKGDKNRGLLVTDKSLFIFRKKNNHSIAELHNKTDRDTILQDDKLKKITEIPEAELKEITIEKVSRKGWSGIRISANSKTHKLTLPSYELSHLMISLRKYFSDKLLLDAPIRFRSWGLLIAISIVSLLAALAMASNKFSMEITNMETGEITNDSGYGLIGLVLIGFLLVFFSLPVSLAIMDHIPAKKENTVKRKANKDKSHSQPFRSLPLSILLKLAGGIIFFIVILLKLYTLSPEAMADPEMDFVRNIPWFFFYGIIGVILSVSYSLSQRNPNKLKGKEGKKPILYLRSFADDRETTLNERSWKSTFMGVSPPYYFLEQYELGERSRINRFAKRLIRFFYRFHPLFLLRLMFGNPKETSEQQLGNFLKRYGFFVAIGKPGEKIVTTGASRMYVTNEEWQQTVLDTLKESVFVVLQPSRTKGIWWEVEQVFNKEAPEKILLSMVNYHGFQDDYETFRIRMESLFPDRPSWPRSIGNEPLISFIGFNKNWEPQIYYLKNYWSISWPFRGSTANLKKTLKPFIESNQHAN